MRALKLKYLFLSVAAAVATLPIPAHAAIVISQVDPYGSSASSGYGADWFVLTNTGTSSQDITGWTMLDNHAASNTATPYVTGATISIGNLTGANKTFGAAALSLASGASSIAAGQSVIFLESAATSNTALIQKFDTAWFGSNVPTNLVFGAYNDGTAANYGLSQTADMVNIFSGSTSSAGLVASVAFGADSASPMGTFDNSAGVNNATLNQKSVIGTDGAMLSASTLEVGVAPVPEPSEWLLAASGLGFLGWLTSRRKKHSSHSVQAVA